MQPEKIFAKSLVMRNLSTFVTVVWLMQKRNQKRKKKRTLCPPPHKKKKKKICNKNKEEKRTPRRRRRRRRLRQSSTPTTPTLLWCDRERTTRTCLKKRGRFCGEFLLLAVFFFLARLRVRRVLRTEKKRVSFLTSRERFLLFWYL